MIITNRCRDLIQERTVLYAAGVFNKLPVYSHDRFSVSMSHDTGYPEAIFAAAKSGRRENVSGLSHLPAGQLCLLEGRGPNSIPQIVEINLSPRGSAEEALTFESFVNLPLSL